MDCRTKPGDLLVASLPGPELTSRVESALVDLSPAGVVLFSRNLRSPAQTVELIGATRAALRSPLLVAIDQEGGRVNRLADLSPPFGELPPAREQARWSERQLEDVWEAVGRALAALGVNVDFAPVVDLDSGEGGNAIGPRSFGSDPGLASTCAARVLTALERAHVAGCLKHFPGLGGTDVDTHLRLAVSPVSKSLLSRDHLQPYRDLCKAAPCVMTAHACYPNVDGPEAGPATFSRLLIGGWLRSQLGYDGLVVTDDLEMGAVCHLGPPGARAQRALEAGADLALFCGELDAPRRARDHLWRLLNHGDLPPECAAASARRRLAVLERLLPRRRPNGAGPESFEAAAADLRASLGSPC